MSNAAPPPWSKRAPGLSAAHKFMLTTLWGWGPYKRTGPEDSDGERQPAEVVRMWASRETLAAATDQSVSTVKNQLRKLAAEGWIRRERGSTMTLAWRAPGVFEYGGRATGGTPRATGEPDHECTPADHEMHPADHECTPARATGGPLSSSHLPIQSSSNVEVEARDHHDPERSQCAKSAQHERERSWRMNRARIEVENERKRASPITGAMPSGTKLPLDVFQAIEAHDNGAWSTSVSSLTWADACADTMDGDNLDLPHVLRLLDAWTAEARPTRQPSQPSKRVLWYTSGDQGRRARAWVERAMESTRSALRVVSDVDVYELELEEMRR